jgi:hypothetical protein
MSPEPNPVDEFVTFIQHQLPGLEDGTYDLELGAYITDDGDPVSDQAMSRFYRFAVFGDRFSFADPASTVSSTFPAANGTGEFETVLAHVVLNGATLPWARSPIPDAPLRAEIDVEADVPTWLAVVVFDDDDVAEFPQLTLSPTTGVVGDLFPVAAYPKTTLGDDYSYFEGATSTKRLQIDQTVDDPVQTIDIPLELWARVAPTLDDLKLTAHVRSLSVENKPLALGATPPSDPIGTFAIVVGNRLPAPDKRSYAYLVSLEGLRDVLPATDDGGTLTDPSIDIKRKLRLAVLAQWSYNNTKRGTAAFVQRLEMLNRRPLHDPDDAPNTNLRVHRDGARPPISDALKAGYVPLDHELRTNETTVSWYHGPLSPIDAASPVLPKVPIASPDEALMFDPTTGLFDASLAAAWTIGRLLALQDKSFATSLYQWKRGRYQDVVDRVERELLAEILGRPEFAQRRAHAVLHATLDLLRDREEAPS